MGPSFDCQLKATINWTEDNNFISYDLDAEYYNKLLYRKEKSSIPCLLVVMCLPRDKNEWIQVSEQQLIIKKCCYYYSVNGEPTENSSTKRVRIPKSQLLTPSAVQSLMERISSGEIS
ncbi:MAG: protein of unknown function (DUF4365) [Candidatus Electronema aureum]|uniref:DUF4365 domain-containing protein n=1 Tax=Candidatus Electronema aureum TaxID=2005002 RepID=A0A521G284_9BACT|nr:MAG: protein of unknown function (DUF4365) [Candidatus Electronema aureum]